MPDSAPTAPTVPRSLKRGNPAIAVRLEHRQFIMLEWLATRAYRCTRSNVVRILIEDSFKRLRAKELKLKAGIEK